MSSAARAYLREVKSRMFCPRSVKAAFLRQLEDDIFLYCEENAGADAAALNARFGAPEVVAEDFLGALDPILFSRAYHSRQRRMTALVVLLLSAAAIIGAFCIREYWAEQESDSAIELVPYEGDLPQGENPGYWVRTNNGKNISYWEFDYETNEWVNVPVPGE